MLLQRKTTAALLAASLALFAASCKKKAPVAPPPPPPAATSAPTTTETTRPPAPVVASFSAEPTAIQRGQSSTLRWEITGNAASVSIDQTIGNVQNTGNRRVFPGENTTYTLTATGPGGATTASATVNVTSPAPPPPPPDTGGANKGTPDARLASAVQDVYFDYDKSDVRGDSQSVLQQDATALKAILADFPSLTIVVEGHCDDRGSAEYNLGLGDRRASSAKDYLVQLGVPAERLQTISYGKERPQCTDENESCWQRNRRAHFSAGQ
ncbi:MAG TPA: peptidoglycan-associated lipoprotein Pal [Bryobacteraceae bacterium]|jgi:peptidoglycan-associated lipoprotein|nr:peptidoglycan-associated lipoprotein Pal [Bryobacteraceae bacterium]